MTHTVFSAVLFGAIVATGLAVRVDYTVKNSQEGRDPHFDETISVHVNGVKPFVKYMDAAAAQNDLYIYNHTMTQWGVSVQAINGVFVDYPNKLFWAFIRRDKGDKDCLMPLGVSNYYPLGGEHIIHSFEKYSIFQDLPQCELRPGNEGPGKPKE